MHINIYYGGRGIIDDPTIFVINKMQEILEELRVHVTRINLYECRNEIMSLPQTLKEADGIILASTVEWYGIGGYMQQFLDACWLFGDKEKISRIYMCPVVMSTTYGEREARDTLCTAWEILGGLYCSGISGYIENTVTMEMNPQYIALIEKRTENMYRAINQHFANFPSSVRALRESVGIPRANDLTPQETEELCKYVSDESYVQQQKEDIQELANMFRGMMESEAAASEKEYLQEFKKTFKPQAGVSAEYAIAIEEKPQKLIITVRGAHMEVRYGSSEKPDVEMQVNRSVMEDIVNGRMTFQRAFMTGAKTKGDFQALRALDTVFPFSGE